MPDVYRLQPLETAGLADCHVHCDYSVDAQGTIEEYCHAAVQRNLAEICFTTHFDTNPSPGDRVDEIVIGGRRLPATVGNLKPYVDDVRRAADEFLPRGLRVKLGVEIGWYEGCERTAERLINTYPFDYVLCGIHELDGSCFCSRGTATDCFRRYSLPRLAERYFRLVRAAAQFQRFDAIAHLGYYLRYGRSFYGPEIETIHEPYMENILPALRASSTGLEINTSAVRHGHTDYYPPASIRAAAARAGVAVSHLGSDAHRPEQIGLDFEVAAALLPQAVSGRDH